MRSGSGVDGEFVFHGTVDAQSFQVPSALFVRGGSVHVCVCVCVWVGGWVGGCMCESEVVRLRIFSGVHSVIIVAFRTPDS